VRVVCTFLHMCMCYACMLSCMHVCNIFMYISLYIINSGDVSFRLSHCLDHLFKHYIIKHACKVGGVC